MYYKNLCQQQSLSDRGRADDMTMNRRRSERIRRVSDSTIIGSVAGTYLLICFVIETAGEKECVCDTEV